MRFAALGQKVGTPFFGELSPMTFDLRSNLMSVELSPGLGGKILNVRVSDKLTAQDYEQFVPEFERLIEEHGKIRVLFHMEDFHGWDLAALWEDIKFDFKHFADIERIAMVGDKAWEEGMSFFCKPFTTAKIRYFGHHETERAWEWISEGIVAVKEETPGSSRS
jgi:hypothetical protein